MSEEKDLEQQKKEAAAKAKAAALARRQAGKSMQVASPSCKASCRKQQRQSATEEPEGNMDVAKTKSRRSCKGKGRRTRPKTSEKKCTEEVGSANMRCSETKSRRSCKGKSRRISHRKQSNRKCRKEESEAKLWHVAKAKAAAAAAKAKAAAARPETMQKQEVRTEESEGKYGCSETKSRRAAKQKPFARNSGQRRARKSKG